MPFPKVAALSLSLFILSLSSHVGATEDLQAAAKKLTPELLAQQKELKASMKISASERDRAKDTLHLLDGDKALVKEQK